MTSVNEPLPMPIINQEWTKRQWGIGKWNTLLCPPWAHSAMEGAHIYQITAQIYNYQPWIV